MRSRIGWQVWATERLMDEARTCCSRSTPACSRRSGCGLLGAKVGRGRRGVDRAAAAADDHGRRRRVPRRRHDGRLLRARRRLAADRAGQGRQARLPRQLGHDRRPAARCPSTAWWRCCRRRRRRPRRARRGSAARRCSCAAPPPSGDAGRTFAPPRRLQGGPRRGRAAAGCVPGDAAPSRSASACCSRSQALADRRRAARSRRCSAGWCVLLAGVRGRARVPRGQVAAGRPDPRSASTRCGARSSGATSWPTPSSRWWPRRGSRAPPPARRRWPVAARARARTIGRGVWCETYWLPEADLVTLGDGASVNRGCVLQTHLFHDRIMSMDTVTPRRGATLGPHGVDPAGRARSARGATVGPGLAGDARRDVPAGTPLDRQPDRPLAA